MSVQRPRSFDDARKLVTLVYRKLVFRELRFVRTGIRAGDSIRPERALPYRVEVWGADRFDAAAAVNPFIRPDDLRLFRSQPTKVAVALDGDEIVGQAWGTTGVLPTDELGERISCASDEVYTCRGHLDPEHQGRGTLHHLLYALAMSYPPDTRVWDLIRDWNGPSLKSVARQGRFDEGSYRASVVLGRRRLEIDRYEPRPIVFPSRQDPAIAVIVADGSWGSALRAAEDLSRSGIGTVVAAVGEGANIYGRSRFVAEAFDVAIDRLADDLVAGIEAAGMDHHDIVVVPTSDRTLEILLNTPLPGAWTLAGPAHDVAMSLLDKRTSFERAESAGLTVPPWRVLEPADELSTLDLLEPPLAVRPTSWATMGERPIKIARCADHGEARTVVGDQLAAGASVIVQSFIPAPESAVEFAIVWTDGEVESICTGRKLRQSDSVGGVMVWGEAVELPDVRSATQQFLKSTGFVGVGGIEFIREGSQLHFIEFNPRLEAIHFLASAAGQPTVVHEFHRVRGRSINPSGQQPAAAWVGGADLQRLLNDRSLSRFVLDRMRFRRRSNRVRAVWAWNDPLPGLALTAYNFGRARRSAAGVGRG